MRDSNELLSGKEWEEAVANRKAAREMARDAAMRGNPICGGYFALRDLHWMAAQIDDFADYDDSNDDDIRPY